MKDLEPSRGWRTVEDTATARLLNDPQVLRVLGPFVAQERKLSEVAGELGLTLNALYLRVKRLEQAGLLVVGQTQTRKGRSVKLYRSSADGFFVPFTAMPHPDLEAIFSQIDQHFLGILVGNLARASLRELGHMRGWGRRVYRRADGEFSVDSAPNPEQPLDPFDPDFPPLADTWHFPVLKTERAVQLRRELFELLGRYPDEPGGRKHIMHLAMAPLEE